MRLYNPFAQGRDSTWLRLGSLLADFDRLNRRRHNKLLIADDQAAISGGSNLADAYFMRSDEANFLDFDLLAVGPIARGDAGPGQRAAGGGRRRDLPPLPKTRPAASNAAATCCRWPACWTRPASGW